MITLDKPILTVQDVLEMESPSFRYFFRSVSPFSNFFHCYFEDEHRRYFTSEMYMMYHKAMLFNDIDVAEQILNVDNPNDAKQLGRQVSNFDQDVWDEHKISIVFNGCYLKFSQNEEIRDVLLDTRDIILVEASKYDRIWGIGLDQYDIDCLYPDKWRGQNLLGFTLMAVRDKIRSLGFGNG